MSTLKTYIITGNAFSGKLVFKYDLNGFLASFTLEDDAVLNEKQKAWLFSPRFPYNESGIAIFRGLSNFTVVEGELKVEFDDFWKVYDLKLGKEPALKAWKKLKEDEKLKAIANVRHYNGYLARKRGIEKARASTYLNQKYFNDSWGSAN